MAGALLVTTLIISCLSGLAWQARDYFLEFSGAEEAARFLLDHGIDQKQMAGYHDLYCASILPYMPKAKMRYIGREDRASYQLWNRETNVLLPESEILRRVANDVPKEQESYLILSFPVHNLQALGYRLIFRNHRMMVPEPGPMEAFTLESFFVYQRVHPGGPK
jgi:hypothetical protein